MQNIDAVPATEKRPEGESTWIANMDAYDFMLLLMESRIIQPD